MAATANRISLRAIGAWVVIGCGLFGVAAHAQAGRADGPAAGEPPVKVESAEQAAELLAGLIKEIGLAEALKLDFESAKSTFEKLQAVRPFVDKLEAGHKTLYAAGLGAVGLVAGEPAASVEGCRMMLADKQAEVWALRGYIAAFIAGDDKSAKQMLTKMDPNVARELARDSDLLGKKIPVLKLDLLGGGTFRNSGEDKVVVFDFWGTWGDKVYEAALPSLKGLQQQLKKHSDDFVILGICMDLPGDRAKAIQFIRDKEMRWLHFFEGKAMDGELSKGVFGIRAIPQVVVVGPDRRILFKCSPQADFLPCVVHAGLRQIEKNRAAANKPVAPDKPPTVRPPATQPAGTVPMQPKTAPDPPTDKAQQMLNLADTYRAAGLVDQADDILRQLIREHPDSPQAATARDKLGLKP